VGVCMCVYEQPQNINNTEHFSWITKCILIHVSTVLFHRLFSVHLVLSEQYIWCLSLNNVFQTAVPTHDVTIPVSLLSFYFVWDFSFLLASK